MQQGCRYVKTSDVMEATPGNRSNDCKNQPYEFRRTFTKISRLVLLRIGIWHLNKDSASNQLSEMVADGSYCSHFTNHDA